MPQPAARCQSSPKSSIQMVCISITVPPFVSCCWLADSLGRANRTTEYLGVTVDDRRCLSTFVEAIDKEEIAT